MISAWRIVKEKHSATAFSGEGAAKFGGRWNSQGVRVVYASSTQALATLETLVHINPPVKVNYVIFRIIFDESLVTTSTSLPPGWRLEPPPMRTKLAGDDWVRSGSSPILAVPSVIIPDEINYLINPNHSGFGEVSISAPVPFSFDPRLL